MRLKPRQWAKIDAHGVDWLRALIDREKPPKTLEHARGNPRQS